MDDRHRRAGHPAHTYSEIPTITRSGPAAVVAKNPVLAVVPHTRLIPRPAGTPQYPALSTAIYQNVNAALAGSASPPCGGRGHAVGREHRTQQSSNGGL